MDPAAEKAALRAQALAARTAQGDAAALDANLRRALAPHAGQVLAGYWPMRGEPDPRPAMAAHDGPVCLPVVPGRAVPLQFRLWRGEPLVAGVFGTSHPAETSPEATGPQARGTTAIAAANQISTASPSPRPLTQAARWAARRPRSSWARTAAPTAAPSCARPWTVCGWS